MGWIGVDLDGTLAHYSGWVAPDEIGKPVHIMVGRVNRWLSEGREVRIFTARVSHDGSRKRMDDARRAHVAIEAWCERYIGQVLPITNVKDYHMIELWDDRAVQVIPNTGMPVGESTRGL